MTTAFATCVGLPVIGVGVLGLSMSLFAAVAIYSAVAAAIALGAAGWRLTSIVR